MATRRRGVDLGEALEQAGQLTAGKTQAGIDHLERQPRLAWIIARYHPHAAGPGELHSVAGKVQQDLPKAICVRHDQSGQTPVGLDLERQTLGGGLARTDRRHVVHHLHRRRRCDPDLDLAGLQPGEVQDVVHRDQQRLAGAPHPVDICLGLRSQALLAFDQIGVSDDGGQRRPQLVAHVGQELGFDRRRILGHGTGGPELFLQGLLPGHVDDRAQDRRHPTLLILLADPLPQHPADLAVRPVHPCQDVLPALSLGQGADGPIFAAFLGGGIDELASQGQVRSRGDRDAEDPAHLGRPLQQIGGCIQPPVPDPRDLLGHQGPAGLLAGVRQGAFEGASGLALLALQATNGETDQDIGREEQLDDHGLDDDIAGDEAVRPQADRGETYGDDRHDHGSDGAAQHLQLEGHEHQGRRDDEQHRHARLAEHDNRYQDQQDDRHPASRCHGSFAQYLARLLQGQQAGRHHQQAD